MSREILHQLRAQMLITQQQLLRDYENASQNWPEMPTVAAQNSLYKAHHAITPLAFTLGQKFGEQFCAAWEDRISAIHAKQEKPTAPRKSTRTLQMPARSHA